MIARIRTALAGWWAQTDYARIDRFTREAEAHRIAHAEYKAANEQAWQRSRDSYSALVASGYRGKPGSY